MSCQNFVPFQLVREQNLSLCTNIAVTYLQQEPSTIFNEINFNAELKKKAFYVE